ncbi:MAG: DUF1207 domain-containing protein [Planctomycetaceae bacterium]
MRTRTIIDRDQRLDLTPPGQSNRLLPIRVFRGCGGILPAILVLLASLMYGMEAVAQQSPWCDEMLVKFPESLLLEREPSALPPPESAKPIATNRQTGIAHVSSSQPLDSTQHDESTPPEAAVQDLQPPPHLAAVAEASTGSGADFDHRRYVFSDSRRCSSCEDWQILPAGILYPSYIAGEKEPRMGTATLLEKDRGPILESIIGGRMGLLRYGSPGPIDPQGWQWDLESAAMLRQDFDEELDVEATDFRIGTVITWRRHATSLKGGIYHISSHVGDEFLERNPGFQRRNYSRDALLFGVYQRLTDELAAYGEIAYGVRNDGGSEPIEAQFGAEYSSLAAIEPGGGPFAAVNVHLREEFDFGGGLNILAGWEWRGPDSNRRFRVGGQYYTGKEIQWSFFDEDVTLYGAGIWYDF